MAAPYDPFPALAALATLLATPEARAWLAKRLEDAGIGQAELEAKVKELKPPEPPA